jgi:hypothetical protein
LNRDPGGREADFVESSAYQIPQKILPNSHLSAFKFPGRAAQPIWVIVLKSFAHLKSLSVFRIMGSA